MVEVVGFVCVVVEWVYFVEKVECWWWLGEWFGLVWVGMGGVYVEFVFIFLGC